MSTARTCPHLSSTGEAADAVAHDSKVLGGTVTSQTFAELGMVQDPADADLVYRAVSPRSPPSR